MCCNTRMQQQVRRGRPPSAGASRYGRTHPEMRIFSSMAATVPAFQRHLKNAGIDAREIRSPEDLARIPPLTKNNYIRANRYQDLFEHGSLGTSHVMTSTSGSTGEPSYFARSHAIDEQSANIHERFFLRSSLAKDKPTLVMVCFGMGVWIGGIITYQAFQTLGKRGHPFSIITPGINMNEILKALRILAPQYPQLILVGYPPFIKDVLDAAHEEGISLSKSRVAILCAAEAFTERFREHIAGSAGVRNALTDIMNIYGSADLGTMAFETPISVLVRRLAMKKPSLFRALFKGASKTPTLAQFVPEYTHFAEQDGELLVSGLSAMPLLRYAIGDQGGVHTLASISALFAGHGIDLSAEARNAGIPAADASLPFVYVYERSDLSTTLYGLQIYPETVKEVLLQRPFVSHMSGRVALVTKYDRTHDQYLEINVELRPLRHATKALSARLQDAIVRNLKIKNGEFRELFSSHGTKAVPRVRFWPHLDPLYFRRDIKQKWVVSPDA